MERKAKGKNNKSLKSFPERKCSFLYVCTCVHNEKLEHSRQLADVTNLLGRGGARHKDARLARVWSGPLKLNHTTLRGKNGLFLDSDKLCVYMWDQRAICIILKGKNCLVCLILYPGEENGENFVARNCPAAGEAKAGPHHLEPIKQ